MFNRCRKMWCKDKVLPFPYFFFFLLLQIIIGVKMPLIAPFCVSTSKTKFISFDYLCTYFSSFTYLYVRNVYRARFKPYFLFLQLPSAVFLFFFSVLFLNNINIGKSSLSLLFVIHTNTYRTKPKTTHVNFLKVMLPL